MIAATKALPNSLVGALYAVQHVRNNILLYASIIIQLMHGDKRVPLEKMMTASVKDPRQFYPIIIGSHSTQI